MTDHDFHKSGAGVLAPVDAAREHEPAFGSNAVRLSLGQWSVAAVGALVVLFALPKLWLQWHPLPQSRDYRIPYRHSDDYWLYSRQLARAAAKDRIAVVGDSVVWGEYVAPEQTLTHYLNAQDGGEWFANFGLNGTHPLALYGLLGDYGAALVGCRVVLHGNLLWMSSPERDLQVANGPPFNHPHLVPQFWPRIPNYSASLEERLGVTVDRQVAFRGWGQHLRISYFDGLDFPTWSLEHPGENPWRLLRAPDDLADDAPRHDARPWFAQGVERQDVPWIDLATSLQWQAFRRTVELLRRRGNQVFVVVGPLNEHMLTPGSRQRYAELREQVVAWLQEVGVPSHAPTLLPSEEFADSSHPLAAGYERMAAELYPAPAFDAWLRDGR